MKLRYWVAAFMAALTTGFWHSPAPVQAAAGAEYTVAPIIPANQRSNVSSYFDLVVKPGTTQDLKLSVSNRTATSRRLRVSLETAFTQINGQVGYQPGAPRDDSAQYWLSDLAPKPQTITLGGNATREVTVPVKIPQGGFRGVMLGSLYVIDLAKPTGGSGQGMQIRNRFATVVGVQLQTSAGALKEVAPHLRLLSVGAGIQNHAPGVLATVQNDRATYWGKMHFNAKVYRRGTRQVVLSRSANNFSVAPNSHFNFGIMGTKALDPGDYTLDLRVTGPHGRWHFKRNFSILAAQADRINHKLGLKRQFVMPWWGWLLIALAVILLAGLVWFGLRRHRRGRQDVTVAKK